MTTAPTPPQRTRRAFLRSTTAGLGAVSILPAPLAFGSQANSAVTLGLIGCGGRGTWIARLFHDSGLYRFVALADYFPDRLTECGEHLGVAPDHRFSGLSGYRRLLEGSSVDAVVIESPPYFHPEHAAAAISAGKHVFLAKPVAVDAPGCRGIADAGEAATRGRLVFLVDFQTRANALYREAVQRVHRGDIGRLVLAEARYPWAGGGAGQPATTVEGQLRQWYYILPLSGDFIVEQSIHALDVATWILNADPIRAIGIGGRAIRPAGSIDDHFAVNFEFPGDVWLSFTCVQVIPGMKDEIRCRVYGSEGYIDTDYFGSVWIRGNEPYAGGSTGNLYTTGAQENIREFHRCITQGDCSNRTVPASVRSNLTAVLGREAGYARGEVTLADLVRTNRRLVPDLQGATA